MVGRGNDVIDLLPPYSSKTSCGALLPEDMEPVGSVTDVPIEETHLQGCYRVPSYIIFLVNLYQWEMRTALHGAAVVEMYADQIETMTTGRRAAGVAVVMEVILVTRGIQEIAEIVETVEIEISEGAGAREMLGEPGLHNGDGSWSSSDDGDLSAFLPVGRGDNPPVLCPAAMNGTVGSNGYDPAKTYVGVKLDVYDGSTCLETFLASVKNFATSVKKF